MVGNDFLFWKVCRKCVWQGSIFKNTKRLIENEIEKLNKEIDICAVNKNMACNAKKFDMEAQIIQQSSSSQLLSAHNEKRKLNQELR